MARRECSYRKWNCSYKRITLFICFVNIVIALYVLRSLYTSLYVSSNTADFTSVVKYTPNQVSRMEESIRIRSENKPVKLIKLVKGLKQREKFGGNTRIEMPRKIKQTISNEIIQRLRSLGANATTSEQQAWCNFHSHMFLLFLLCLEVESTLHGYFIYFVLTPIAACNEWQCWSYFCSFIFMALPKIIFFAAFLLLLSFWADLCHQSDDEDEEDDEHGFLEVLLEKSLPATTNTDGHRLCFPFKLFHVGSRQKIMILVTDLEFVLMIMFVVLIWIGMGSSPIDSSDAATVYIDLIAGAMLLLGGALAVYRLLLCLKMRKVRSERATSEVLKNCFSSGECESKSAYL